MQDKHSKTEDATPKRLSDSKKKGQVAKSIDFNSAVSFFVFTLCLGLLMQYLFSNSMKLLKMSFSAGISGELSTGNAGAYLIQCIWNFITVFLPFGLIAVAVGIAANLAQVGFIFTGETLKPDFKKLNPLQGFKNMFSAKSLFNLVKNLIKLTIVIYIAFLGLQKATVQIMNSGEIGVEKIFTFFISIVQSLSFQIAGFMIVIGIADYIFQRRSHKKNLKMTKQEIKDEYKEMEGDPGIKSARRQKQREISMSRRLQNVEKSTVIITNPTHIAIALKYEQGKDQAPIVMAKGLDFAAQKIKETAKGKGIPIIENKPLARTIYYSVEEGSFVPVELYQAVAEVLAMVYNMKRSKKKFN